MSCAPTLMDPTMSGRVITLPEIWRETGRSNVLVNGDIIQDPTLFVFQALSSTLGSGRHSTDSTWAKGDVHIEAWMGQTLLRATPYGESRYQ